MAMVLIRTTKEIYAVYNGALLAISQDCQIGEYALEAWLSFREKHFLRFLFVLQKRSTLFKTGLY